jgi:hypothetical protein
MIAPAPPTAELPKPAAAPIAPTIPAPLAAPPAAAQSGGPKLPALKIAPLVAPPAMTPVPPPAGQTKPTIIAPIPDTEPSAPGATAPPISAPIRKREVKKKPPVDRSFFGVVLRELVLMALLGAVLAAVIEMAREPRGVPPGASANSAGAQETVATLRASGESVRPISWTVNQNAINEFLATTIQMDSSVGSGGARFERAFVILNSGSLDLGIEQKLLGRSLFFLLHVTPEPTDAGLTARVTGGAIGRLPIHPRLLPVLMRFFDQTITGLAQPLELLRGVKSAVLKPGDVTLQWAGSKSH